MSNLPAVLDVGKAVERIEHIGSLAVTEIEKRLKENPDDFNSATLVRLSTEATKIGLLFDRRQKPVDTRPDIRYIQVVTDPGLPPERQRELLVQGIKTMEGAGLDASELRSALTNLAGEKEAHKLLAIEEK